MADVDVDAFTKPFQLTKSLHRDIYPAVDPKNPELSAHGKVILITGVTGTIGADIALAWATAGATGIAITGRNLNGLNEVAAKIEEVNDSVKVLVHSCDTTSESAVEDLYKAVCQTFEKVHVLVNSAGHMNDAIIGEITPTQWWSDFEINVKAPYLMSHYFIKYFGGEGTIINLSTILVHIVYPGISSYSASKLALLKTSEYLQADHPNLRVFSMLPGAVLSNMTKAEIAPFAIDTGRLSGGMTLYLSTSKADYLIGGVCSVNWDVNEMELHKDEIVEKNLVKSAFLNARLGPEGHPWGS